MVELQELQTAIVTGKLPLAISTTQKAIEEGIEPQVIINEYMVKAMEEIGTRFENGKAFVPELLMAARAMKGSLDLLKPYLATETNRSPGKIVIGTVKGIYMISGKPCCLHVRRMWFRGYKSGC